MQDCVEDTAGRGFADRPSSSPGTEDAAQFEQALAHHQAGRVRQAAAIYREILARDPDHVDSLHMAGVAEIQSGHPALALPLLDRALVLVPDDRICHANRAAALSALGRV